MPLSPALRTAAIAALLVTLLPLNLTAQRTWTEVRSPHFLVVGDNGDRAGRNVAWQFEQVRAAIRAAWSWANVDMDRPFVVLLARDEDGMKQLAPQYWESRDSAKPVSVSVSAPDRHYVALRADASIGDDRVGRVNPYISAYWAYSSTVIGTSLGYNLPPWFARGLASVLSNTIVTDSSVEIGRVNPNSLEQLSYRGRLRLADLVSADRQSPQLRGDQLLVFDAQAALFVHYLMFADAGAHREPLNQFLKLISDGTTPAEALRSALGSLDTLENGFTQYLSKKLFNFAKLDADVSLKREAFAARAMTPPESAGLRAAFHAAMKRPAEARALIAEARKADPNLAAAYEVEGLLLDFDQKPDDAREAYGRAQDNGTTNFYAKYRWAALTWQRQDSDAPTRSRVQQVLEQAARLNTRSAPTYAMLAEVKSRLESPEAALPLAAQAVAIDPSRLAHRLLLARLLWMTAKRDEAQQEVQRAMALAVNDAERQAVQQLLTLFQNSAGRGGTAQPVR